MTDIPDLVPFSSGIARLGIPPASAERYLRGRAHLLPPVHRIGWHRFFKAEELAMYEAVDRRLQQMESFAAWWPSRVATSVTR